MDKQAVAVVWDFEDVAPTISSPFIKGLRSFVGIDGKISISYVYGDFSKQQAAQVAPELHGNAFELVHLPAASLPDITTILTARILKNLTVYPYIEQLILISGRRGLIPLIQQARSLDIETMVICDAQNTDEQLLLMADNFCDFRDLTVVPLQEEYDFTKIPSINLDQSLLMLQEAIAVMHTAGRGTTTDLVRVRLKLLNEQFDEKLVGFDSWNAFLIEAQKCKAIRTRFKDNELILTSPNIETKYPIVPDIILSFLKALNALRTFRTSVGNKAVLTDIGKQLADWKIDFQAHGYSSIKKVADGAAKRGLVSVGLHESTYVLDLTQKGRDLIA